MLEFARRASGHLAWRIRRATTRAVDRLRAGDRTVVMTPEAGLRFGNWLYLWLDAHQRTAAGERTVVLETPGMREWLRAFPALRGLTVEPDLLRFHDRREWDDESWSQRFDIDFTPTALDAFIADTLAPYIRPDTSGTLVINVRRGDYYSNPNHRRRYGFDQVGYIGEALGIVDGAARALVVSDDPQWCRENLDGLIRARCAIVDYAEPGAEANFRSVAGASRIIGTNSTFTYWAAYVAGVLHEDPQVIMPRFHGRLPQGTAADQLDPTWTVIDGFH